MSEEAKVIETPIWDAMKRYKLSVRVVGLRQFRVRTWIAIRLVCIAARLLGMDVEWSVEFPVFNAEA